MGGGLRKYGTPNTDSKKVRDHGGGFTKIRDPEYRLPNTRTGSQGTSIIVKPPISNPKP